MTYEQAVTMTVLISAAQNVSFTEEKQHIWHGLLEDLDYNIAALALKELLRTELYTITPAHIRKAYADIAEPQPDAAEAWKTLLIIVGYGRYNYAAAMEYAETQNPVVVKLVKELGYINLCNADPDKLRVDFEILYKDTAKAYMKERMLPAAIKRQIANMRLSLENQHFAAVESEDDAEYLPPPMDYGDRPRYTGISAKDNLIAMSAALERMGFRRNA
ncbi:MAG: hypothetical protein LBS19_02145 [Clostridiales bacterium]|jgi:hypothetical protein|nr:hypothetical protein [Clostridiales bacterium]